MSNKLKLFLPSQAPSNLKNILIAFIGSFVAISIAILTSRWLLAEQTISLWIVASMGASAVLLFAAPQVPFSQPWAFVVGHLISGFIGISVAMLVPDLLLAAALAVSLAIVAMLLSKSVHPPGGATALSAVVGGEAVQQLGYWYLITPIFLNVVLILAWALLINNIFSGREYPINFKH